MMFFMRINLIVLSILILTSFFTQSMQQRMRTDGMSQQIAVAMNVIPNQIKRGSVRPQLIADQLETCDHESSIWFLNPQNWFSKKLVFCASVTVLAGYLWLCYEGVQLNNFFKDPNNWLSWHADWPYQMIMAMPQQQFARELLEEIQQRYVPLQNPNDSAAKLSAFVADIDYEIERLAHFAKIASMIHWINLPAIFPVDQQFVQQIDLSSKRLLYIKQIVLTHANDTMVHGSNAIRRLPVFGD